MTKTAPNLWEASLHLLATGQRIVLGQIDLQDVSRDALRATQDLRIALSTAQALIREFEAVLVDAGCTPIAGHQELAVQALAASEQAMQAKVRELEELLRLANADTDLAIDRAERWKAEALSARVFLDPDATTRDVCVTSGGWCSWGPGRGGYRDAYAAARAANEEKP